MRHFQYFFIVLSLFIHKRQFFLLQPIHNMLNMGVLFKMIVSAHDSSVIDYILFSSQNFYALEKFHLKNSPLLFTTRPFLKYILEGPKPSSPLVGPLTEGFWPPIKVLFGLKISDYHAKIAGNQVLRARKFKNFLRGITKTILKVHTSPPFYFCTCYSAIPFYT